jgi:hypothetical protein
MLPALNRLKTLRKLPQLSTLPKLRMLWRE